MKYIFEGKQNQKIKMSTTSVLIHELFHISPTKRGCRDHTGFGDETIFRMYKSNISKLRRLR